MTQMGVRPFDGTEWRPAEFDEGMDGSTIVEDIHFSTNRRWLDVLIFPAMWAQFRLRGPVYRRFFGKAPASRKP